MEQDQNDPLNVQPESLIPAPALPGRVVTAETPERVMELLAADLIAHALNCVRHFGDFHLALSGGNTPMPFYELLMVDPDYRVMPWRRTHLWVVDERRVGFEDPRSNWRHIHEILVNHSDIPAEQAHPILATQEDAPEAYERLLRETLGWREKILKKN